MAVTERDLASQPLELGANLQAGIVSAKRQNQALMQLMKELLEVGVDYDQIKGTPKPTLLQPGAQQLCTVFHFCPGYSVADKTEILEAGKEFLSYVVVCRLVHRDSGFLIAEGIGSANSRETKHRYRYEYDGDDKRRIENQEIWDLQNTIIKMAKKRALVDAALNATGASRLFTQDLEDLREMSQQASVDQGERPNKSHGSSQQAGGVRLRSDKQAAAIKSMLRHKFDVVDSADVAQVCEILADAPLDQLGIKQASDLIDQLNKLSDSLALDSAMSEAAARRSDGGGQQ